MFISHHVDSTKVVDINIKGLKPRPVNGEKKTFILKSQLV